MLHYYAVLHQKILQDEKEKLENKLLRQKEFDIYFEEWKKKRINYPRPEPPIVISSGNRKYVYNYLIEYI